MKRPLRVSKVLAAAIACLSAASCEVLKNPPSWPFPAPGKTPDEERGGSGGSRPKEAGAPRPAEEEPNETASQANAIGLGEAVTGGVGGEKDGAADWFRFRVEAEGEVWGVLTNTLTQDAQGAVGGRILSSSQTELMRWGAWCGPASNQETRRFLAEPGVDYFVSVVPQSPAHRTGYLLEIRQSPR